MVKLPKAQEVALFYKSYLKLSPGRQRRKPNSTPGQWEHRPTLPVLTYMVFILWSSFYRCSGKTINIGELSGISSLIKKMMLCRRNTFPLQPYANRERVHFCAAAVSQVSQPSKGTLSPDATTCHGLVPEQDWLRICRHCLIPCYLHRGEWL